MDNTNTIRWEFRTKKINLSWYKSVRDENDCLYQLEMFREKPVDPEKEYWWPATLLLGVSPIPITTMGPLLVHARYKHPNATLREAFVSRRQYFYYGLVVLEPKMEDKLITWEKTGITTCKK